MSRIRALTLAAALLAPLSALADTGSSNPPGQTSLTLMNGWRNGAGGASKASISAYKGIVHLKGAIWTNGANDAPFVVPAAFRPAGDTFIKVDMCNATNGRLTVDAAGNVHVQAENNFLNAACMTSLDGVTWATTTDGFKTLKLKNGWKAYGSGTVMPAARIVGGMVHLEGAIHTSGDNGQPFVLPASMRPTQTVYLPVDMTGATNGRLIVFTDGVVQVQAETDFANAAGFTSLDGVWFARDTTGFTPLSLTNGWVNSGFGTQISGVRTIAGTVHFQGAISNGTDAAAFVLPNEFRPSKNVFLPVDMCDATPGRLNITPDGTVSVQSEIDFSKAKCFTSLEGVSFHL